MSRNGRYVVYGKPGGSGSGNLAVYDVVDRTSTDLPSSLGTTSGGGNTGTIVPGLTLASNLLQADSTFTGFGITPVSQKTTQKVSEIALFAVDDLTGKIGSLAPGQGGYLALALQNAKTIFSTLGGSFFSTDKRELALDPSKTYQALEIVDGSLLDAKQQLASGKTPNNLLFSLPDANGNSPIKITNTAKRYRWRQDLRTCGHRSGNDE